ncbi:G-alpha-domain-containing protein [Wolfiporia cocos MD-104 SS10]|uniref:G-alpha-domain-containing protein n=1 Tax=Wolfiporia cocos (strain MD-104) TaxID=742152 RepID=A0A2H3JRJ1_WOLCO|nr:G-alpha-domain-containing protein [Wolfiporia cocos MD-104 SS10]
MPSRAPPDRDPLDAVLRPPLDETPEEKAFRVAQEEEARRISQEIDENIRQDKLARKKMKVVRLLLLGQSESGKSTTLRQFQRLYTPSAFREERCLWHSIIQLNLVRSIHTILDALADVRPHELPFSPPSPSLAPSLSFGSYTQPPSPPRPFHAHAHSMRSTLYSDSDAETDSTDAPTLPAHLTALRQRLACLQAVEELLISRIVPPSEDAPYLHQAYPAAPFATASASTARMHAGATGEVFVRPSAGWKRALRPGASARYNVNTAGEETTVEVQSVLAQCRVDMMTLWKDSTVKSVLKKRKIRLEESPGFFLDELERVASLKYTPSDDDVLKARLKTVGVSEYRFEMEAGTETGTQWRIIDVGGSRSQGQTWVPFFDDVDAIIFLAPISGFDQTLAEDKSVNRLEDSVLLWKAVCANKLLARVDLVLFLNKCDILAVKLASGVRLAKYVKSFGERANDSETAEKYFRSKFNAIHREYSPIPRKFYGFCTSVTDTTTTGGIIASVRDMVVREHLKASKLL